MQATGLSNLVVLQSFTVFPEYFISVSLIYVLIVIVLITYNVYGLMLQKALSECLALILIMTCYLIINDDLLILDFITFNSSIINDYFAFVTKFIVCLSSAIYFLIISNYLKEQKLTSFEYLIITLFAVLGLILLCSSNDLLTAYLAIELFSLSFYVLAAFKKSSIYSVEGGLKYFVVGAISSAFFLLGSSFVYGYSGSIIFSEFLTFFDKKLFQMPLFQDYWATTPFELLSPLDKVHLIIYYWYHHPDAPAERASTFVANIETNFVEIGLLLILFSLFIKLALAPFHLWSLDVYEGSPTSATFFFAVISKLSIFVLLTRLCYKSFPRLNELWQFYSLLLAILSIFVGAFGGLKQRKLKTLLAYSSIAHMGYILLAFSTNNFIGVEMLFFYLIIYVIVGLAVWFIILAIRVKQKTLSNKYNKELGDLAALNKANPALAFAFALTMFSLAGIPPMIGFIAKMSVFLSIINQSFYLVSLMAILFSIISTFYYIRIVKILYFENCLTGKLYYPIINNKILILSLLIIMLLFFFVNPTLLYLINYKLILSLYIF